MGSVKHWPYLLDGGLRGGTPRRRPPAVHRESVPSAFLCFLPVSAGQRTALAGGVRRRAHLGGRDDAECRMIGRVGQGTERCADRRHLAVTSRVGLDEGGSIGDGPLAAPDLLDAPALDQPASARGAQVEHPVTLSAVRDEVALAVVFENDDGQGVPSPTPAAGYRQLLHQ